MKTSRWKKVVSTIAAIGLGVGLAIATVPVAASATVPAGDCVPSEAVPGIAAIWANFSPNDSQATFVGPPEYPTDSRGTWHDHGQLPPGQAGPDGVYANGNPDQGGNWFYRQAEVTGTPAVICPEEPIEEIVVPAVNFIETSHVQYCGGVDITLRNVSPWIYPTSVKIDGVHSYGPTVDNRTDGKLNGPQKDASKTRTITFPEDSGTHTVKYVMDAGSEKDLYKDKAVGEWTVLTIETDCAPPPIRPTCTTVEGSVTLTAPEYVGDVLTLVTTDDEQGSWLIPFEGTLADIGTVLEVDADPSQFVGLWIYVDGMGWIVYEEGYYGGDLWSNTTFPGIDPKHGYAAGAPIGDYIALYGDLGAEAWLLYGSSEPGSTAVTSVTVGCTTYTFDFEEAIIVPEEPVVPASSGLPATGGDVTLPLGLAGILLALGGAVAIGRRVFR